MEIGIYSNAFRTLSLEAMLEKVSSLGIKMVELACGEYSGFCHVKPEVLLADNQKLIEFKQSLDKHGVQLSCLSAHGNPISPNKDIAGRSDRAMRNAVLLAEKLELDTITVFSGCPGDCEQSQYANWITVNWPLDYNEAYKWQWDVKLIPYWKDFAAFARSHKVNKIALEMHPGQCCYNPGTIRRLRDVVGEEIGVNLDFSHLLWQRMDPIQVIKSLNGCIFHMHAKDIGFDEAEVQANGYITTTSITKPTERPWNFRTVGYGHDLFYWKNIFAELRRVGYDRVSSIEIECELVDIPYGVEKSVEFLKQCMLFDNLEKKDKWGEYIRRSEASYFENIQ